jgi:aspartyl-tRNA(Asn)/glutamyl-tRNA(Gln) amidotransferase subunit A
VPTAGVVPLSWTMDHVAPMAATTADAALMLDAMRPASPAVAPWAGTSVAGVRIGVPGATFEGAEPGVTACVERAVAALAGAGCLVVPTARPTAADLEAANSAGLIVSRCEAAAFHRALGADPTLYWEEVADQLDAATGVAAVDYIDAQRLRAELAEGFLALFEKIDLLAMPTVPIVAPPVADFARHLLLLSRNAIPWSFTGFPAVSVPCGWSEGLPVGLQLVAVPGREDLLVAAGAALEATQCGGQGGGVLDLGQVADSGKNQR